VVSPENEPWSTGSPYAKLEIAIANPDASKFEVGKEYDLEFSPAQDKAQRPTEDKTAEPAQEHEESAQGDPKA
jgi:hypothetical protein